MAPYRSDQAEQQGEASHQQRHPKETDMGDERQQKERRGATEVKTEAWRVRAPIGRCGRKIREPHERKEAAGNGHDAGHDDDDHAPTGQTFRPHATDHDDTTGQRRVSDRHRPGVATASRRSSSIRAE